ncbi:hypothetical protein K438DRAFT_1776666 [Mycena galopus ATCC 62051]|nr:hypothetical protein K438DRAFT_1776666 [Mycena galopus ATCC 62051]
MRLYKRVKWIEARAANHKVHVSSRASHERKNINLINENFKAPPFGRRYTLTHEGASTVTPIEMLDSGKKPYRHDGSTLKSWGTNLAKARFEKADLPTRTHNLPADCSLAAPGPIGVDIKNIIIQQAREVVVDSRSKRTAGGMYPSGENYYQFKTSDSALLDIIGGTKHQTTSSIDIVKELSCGKL